MCATCTIAVNGIRQSETEFEKIGEGIDPPQTHSKRVSRERERGKRQRERKQIFCLLYVDELVCKKPLMEPIFCPNRSITV